MVDAVDRAHPVGGITSASRQRRRALLTCFVGTASLLLGSAGAGADASPSGLTTFDKAADIAFSRTLSSSAMAAALAYRRDGYVFKSLEEVNRYNIRSARALAGTAQRFSAGEMPLESPHWWTIRTPGGADALIRSLAAALRSELRGAARITRPRVDSALQKALMQRDLFQIYCLVMQAHERLRRKETRISATRVAQLLAALIERTLLTEEEYRRLGQSRTTLIPQGFVSTSTHSLAENYLPLRVVASDDSWTEMPDRGRAFRHFETYGGRSLIRIYYRAPTLTSEQILSLWAQLHEWYGANLHASAVTRETPAGLETMLVRTFGVFLTDGSYRDSFFPEEVIIRIFKHPRETLDLASSDFRGTLFYQYKMVRSKLVASPASLGLVRIHDDDDQFFGFFGHVPDPSNSYSDAVTTMRSNCIGCHSELFYGLATIFSFERDPATSMGSPFVQGDLLQPMPGGGYALLTREARSLRTLLERTNAR